jgi:hypothetical protein
VSGMKKAVLFGTVAALLAAGLLIAGCGSSTSASKGSSGALTEASVGAPIYPGATKEDVSQLRSGNGANGFRPRGSTPQGSTPLGSTPQGSVPNWRGQGSAPGARNRSTTGLWTKDSTDKVAAWYKDQLSGKKSFSQVNMPNFSGQANNTTTYRFTSGQDTVMVMIRPAQQSKGGTTIMVSKSNGQVPSFPNGGPGGAGQNPYQNQNPNQNPGQSF